MKKILAIVFITVMVNNSFCQQFTDFYGDYLGQPLPGDTPVVFMPDIVSAKNLEHSAAHFSGDGKVVYWISGENLNSENYIQRLWFMKRINNRWTRPAIIQLLSDSAGIGGIYLSADDNKLYFSARIDKTPKKGINKQDWMRYYNYDIWFVNRIGDNWSKPENIGRVINDEYGQGSASFNNDGTIYFLSYLEGVKSGCGIFKSEFKDGEFVTPVALPECINSKTAQDWTPFIAKDDSYIIFSSYREGQIGNGDLYISFHNIENDTWSEAVNMGAPVNTRRQERFPAITPDGKYLFFTRSRKEYSQDIWWVKSAIIERLRSRAVFK